MRIGGIASGMDTEQMVKDLMKAERTRLNKFLRQEQTIKWRQEAFFDINRTLANFILNSRNDLGLNQVSNNGTIRKTSVDSFTWVKATSSSNEGVLTATARAGAINGEHTVKVDRLSSNPTLTTTNLKSSNVIDDNNNFVADGEITVATQKGSAVISFVAGENIGTFISKINAAQQDGANLGLKAAYDANLGQMMISTTELGSNSKIELSDITGTNVEKMFGSTAVSKNGTNAAIEFNGNYLEMPTNNFTVFGVELNLKATTPLDTTVKINVNTNTDGIMDKIKGFINHYNEMIDTVSGKIGEAKYRDFYPLVQDEKSAMAEKEIELWEEKAKSGLLRNEEGITRALQTIRGDLYKDVVGASGPFKHLNDIGITTGNYKDGGKLTINEEKLKNSINSNPEGVMDLFFKVPDSGLSGEARTQESGIIQRMYDGVVSGMKEVIRKSGTGNDEHLMRSVQGNILMDFVTKFSSVSALDKDLRGLNTRIIREEDILNNRENRYWKQFSAMEKAMNQMQQQSMWLMSQMGGMGA